MASKIRESLQKSYKLRTTPTYRSQNFPFKFKSAIPKSSEYSQSA